MNQIVVFAVMFFIPVSYAAFESGEWEVLLVAVIFAMLFKPLLRATD